MMLIAFVLLSIMGMTIGDVIRPTITNEGGRIVGGRTAAPHSHPYQVSLQRRILWIHRHNCGGSILTDTWVLTAGHCVQPSRLDWLLPTDVIAGIHSVRATESSAQTREIVERVIHPEYKGGVNPYDIALVRMESPLHFNKKVQPIRLPEPYSTPIGESKLSGWGLTRSTPREAPEYLQEIDLPILTHQECNESIEALKSSDDDRNPLDEFSNICTGPLTGGKSACNGDSGGPLTYQDGNETVQIGIVSWGYNPCGTKGAPSVYTKVSSFVDFIEEHLDFDDYRLPSRLISF